MAIGYMRSFSLMPLLLALIKSLQSFQILNCGSDKIIFAGSDNSPNKSIITYSSSVDVFNNPLTIWCYSDSPFDQCILHHQKTGKTKCKWDSTKNLVGSCDNPSYTYEIKTLQQKCEFNLNNVEEKG